MSATPKGTSFTHMRFFLDTEASGSEGQGNEKRGEAGKGSKDGSRRMLAKVLFKAAIWMALGQWLNPEW